LVGKVLAGLAQVGKKLGRGSKGGKPIVVRTARVLIEALKAQPIMLGLLALNAIFLAAICYAVVDQRENESALTKLLLDQNARTIELLARCGPPA
jgi:hypothetical protein